MFTTEKKLRVVKSWNTYRNTISKVIWEEKLTEDENHHRKITRHTPQNKNEHHKLHTGRKLPISECFSAQTKYTKECMEFPTIEVFKNITSYLYRIVCIYSSTRSSETRRCMIHPMILGLFLQWCKGKKNSPSHLKSTSNKSIFVLQKKGKC